MKLSTTLAVFSLLAALSATACGSDAEPEESGGQTSELTDAERIAAKGESPSVETAGTVTHTDLTTGSSTCATCGPLPDPWAPKGGPLPDPWKSTSGGGGGTGTGTASTGTGSSGSGH